MSAPNREGEGEGQRWRKGWLASTQLARLSHRFHCSFILEFLASAGVTLANYGSVVDKCGSAISLLTSGSDFIHRSGGYVQKFVDALKVCTKRTLSFISLFILLLLSFAFPFLPACLSLR